MGQSSIKVLQTGPAPSFIQDQIDGAFQAYRLHEAPDPDTLLKEVGEGVRGIVSFGAVPIDAAMMARLPNLEIVSHFGVGYDNIDVKWAAEHGIVVANTPDVVTEETADTAIGLLINTVRKLPQAERYLRAGRWVEGPFPLSATLRNRSCGLVGMGRIGRAVARRLDAFSLPVVYHSRRQVEGVPYRYYDDLIRMATDVDVLIVTVPGGAATNNLINRQVLEALGSEGVLVNIARGSVVDEASLIDALRSGTILAAGLDVFVNEPHVPPELIEMEDACVLLPHVGSASTYTRRAMGQGVVDNLTSWAAGKGPISPVPETPWPPARPGSP